jgi:hypothetical protein
MQELTKKAKGGLDKRVSRATKESNELTKAFTNDVHEITIKGMQKFIEELEQRVAELEKNRA